VAVYQGNPSVHNYGLMTHSNYFLGLLKTRNRFSATSVDQLPHHLTSHLMYGHGLLLPIPDIDHTDFMLIGGNPLASNGSIMTVPDVEAPEGAAGPGRQSGGGRPAAQRNGGDGRSASVHAPWWRCGAAVRLLNTCLREPDPRQSLAGHGLEEVREPSPLYRRGHEPPVRCRPSRSANWRFRRRGQSGVLWPHGRFDPGVRHAATGWCN
jgi:hypothetical protein